jgi:hypothetical protein
MAISVFAILVILGAIAVVGAGAAMIYVWLTQREE